MIFITDRSYEDVQEAQRLNRIKETNWTDDERDRYVAGLKGSYTYIDMNRVESNVGTLRQMLGESGVSVNIVTKTDWTKEDIPEQDDIQRYTNNIKEMLRAFAAFPTTPSPPDNLLHLGYESANDIERILFDINRLIKFMERNINLGWAMGIAHIGLHSSI